MPEHPGGGHKSELPQHVKDNFTRRGRDPDDFPPRTRATFATLSADEISVLDRVEASLEADGADQLVYTGALH